MKTYENLGGGSWGERIVVLAVGVYAYLFATRPEAVVRSASGALSVLVHFFTLVLAAMLLANALGELLPEETVVRYLGSEGARWASSRPVSLGAFS